MNHPFEETCSEMTRRLLNPGQRYRAVRWALVQLRRLSRRYDINFDNAAESSRKDLSPTHKRDMDHPSGVYELARTRCPYYADDDEWYAAVAWAALVYEPPTLEEAAAEAREAKRIHEFLNRVAALMHDKKDGAA